MHRFAQWLWVLPAFILAMMIGPPSSAAARQPDPAEPAPIATAPAPPPAATPPEGGTTVKIDVVVEDILEIDERDNTFQVNVTLTAQWVDKRAAPPNCSADDPPTVSDGEAASEQLKSGIWSPGFHVVEARSRRETSAAAVTVRCDGNVRYVEKFVTTVIQQFDELNDFPFDDHRMSFTIAPFAEAEKERIEFERLSNLGGGDAKAVRQWHSEEWDFTVTYAEQIVDAEAPSIETVIRIDRKSKYYWLNIIGPLLLIVALSWTVFWMKLELAERLGVSITILLTVVAFDFLTSDNLPRLSYTTRLDAFYNVSYVSVAVTVLISIIATRRSGLHRHQRPAASTNGETDEPAGTGAARQAETPSETPADAPAGTPAAARAETRAATPAAARTDEEPTSRLDVVARVAYPLTYSGLVALALTGSFSPGPTVFTEPAPEEFLAEMELDVPSRIDDAPELMLETGVSGVLDTPGEPDFHRLCAPGGDAEPTVTVSVKMERLGEDDALDPYLLVYDGSFTDLDDVESFIAADDDSGGGLDSLVVFDAAPGSCYLVVADDLSQSQVGEYQLTATTGDRDADVFEFSGVEVDLGSTAEELRSRAEALLLDAPVPAAIGEPEEFDTFRVCTPDAGGENLSITMTAAAEDGLLDPFLAMYTDDGAFITSDDDGAGNLNSLAIVPAEPGACYLIIAADLDQQVGDYVIAATFAEVRVTSDAESEAPAQPPD